MIAEKINKLNLEKDESLEITEKVFDFIIQAKSKFNHGSFIPIRKLSKENYLKKFLKKNPR